MANDIKLSKAHSQRITIIVDFSLKELRQAYTRFHGKQDKPPTKKEIAVWIGSLANADLETI